MTEVLDININTQENINVYLPEEVSCGTIEAYFGESAELTLDVSLKYIKSGQQAIQDYVNTQINPTFYKYIDEAKEAAKNADADADNASESAGLAYQSEVRAKESELNAKTSENNAKTSELNVKNSEVNVSQDATSAAESAYNAQQSALAAYEYASNADEDAQNALETLGHVLESQEKASQSELNAKASEEKSKASEVNAKTSEINAKASENKATQEANASAESAYQSQQSALASYEYASNSEADSQNANEALVHALESEERTRISEENAKSSETNAKNSADEASQFVLECQAIKDSLGSIYQYKGSVNTIADLPENANIGDVYDVLDSGTNYAWTGDRWDSLGASFDLSEYAKKTDIKNGTLTIQKNGVNVAIFTANQSGNTTANIVADTQVNADWNATGGVAQILNKPIIPTTTSQLTNNSDFTTKAYVDTTEQEIIQNFMDADTALQTQITGLSGVLDSEQDKITAIEGKIPTNASTSNMLSTASDLLNATQDVRSDFADADSELQTQINGQATVLEELQDDVMANMGEIADIKEQIKNFDALPSQTGNAGKYLTTNGTTASWGDVVSSTITYWE